MSMTLLEQIHRLIAAGAWIQIQEDEKEGFGPRIALGAAAWIDGRGLLFAELGAQHQGHVHLIPAVRLEPDGHMVDAYDARGQLVAMVHDMSAEEAQNVPLAEWMENLQRDAWKRAWAAQIEYIKA